MSTISGTAANYLELLDALDSFLTSTGHAWGKAFEGQGDGDLVDYIGTTDTVAETITVEFTSSTEFDVTGSVSGALPSGEVGTPYSSDVVEFTIEAGATPFAAGDKFYLSTSPAWTRSREAGCPDTNHRTTNLASLESLFDNNFGTYAERAATDGFVEFTMHRPTEVRQFRLGINLRTVAPSAFSLQYRDVPGDPWTTAQSWAGETWAQDNISRDYTLAAAPGAHKYWRFAVTASTGAALRIAEFALFEKPGDAYNLAERFEIIWQAPGLDGAKSIPIGCRTYGLAATDTFNLAFASWRQTNDAAAIASQPNGSGIKTLSLINSPIAYWIIANGQRFIVLAKFASLYQFAYVGFGLPYEPPSVHPFPAIVGASIDSLTRRYNSTQGDFRYPADPGSGLAAFYPDGQWRQHVNRNTTGSPGSEGSYDLGPGKVWPAEMGSTNAAQPSVLRENLDGSHPLLPAILYHRTGPAHVWGEFDGVYWTTGFNTVAEAVIREAGFDHLVVNNIFRNGVQHYCALRLD